MTANETAAPAQAGGCPVPCCGGERATRSYPGGPAPSRLTDGPPPPVPVPAASGAPRRGAGGVPRAQRACAPARRQPRAVPGRRVSAGGCRSGAAMAAGPPVLLGLRDAAMVGPCRGGGRAPAWATSKLGGSAVGQGRAGPGGGEGGWRRRRGRVLRGPADARGASPSRARAVRLSGLVARRAAGLSPLRGVREGAGAPGAGVLPAGGVPLPPRRQRLRVCREGVLGSAPQVRTRPCLLLLNGHSSTATNECPVGANVVFLRVWLCGFFFFPRRGVFKLEGAALPVSASRRKGGRR